MNVRTKNGWKVPNKSWKKVSLKLRLGTLTVVDVYFTIGEPKFTLTILNFSVVAEK